MGSPWLLSHAMMTGKGLKWKSDTLPAAAHQALIAAFMCGAGRVCSVVP